MKRSDLQEGDYFTMPRGYGDYRPEATFQIFGGSVLLVSPAGGAPTLRVLLDPPPPPHTIVVRKVWQWQDAPAVARPDGGQPSPYSVPTPSTSH